ncbi:BTB/POZ domain-containing protein At5g60050 isoform X1 [Selaginella moellendorffii]|uniref:BTB/POZ domain-containing protein At5g60050 isoform X1 n=1 Tax=Selaginella moellendorffii TaxID=88036 RepID=UPI000D1CA559|nr:BTB/POZ domain-containing protein At5g60050 isoform X1 [Selaginella moellendorffii]|eukprot:XP_024529473.1 BTB/POZ domain-containing protein At5g60050 isoform X1 [Selaginella moellendorffii]
MAPGGMPNYTKLGNGGNTGSYAIPPSPPADHSKVRSSHHTLFEMLSSDQGSSSSLEQPQLSTAAQHFQQVLGNPLLPPLPPPSMSLISVVDQQQQQQQQMIRQQPPQQPQNHSFPIRSNAGAQQQALMLAQQQQQESSKQESLQERVNAILSCPLNTFNDASTSDVKLTLISRDVVGGLTVTVHVHTRVLVASSRYFAAKLAYRQQQVHTAAPYSVEISDCEDVEIYLLTIRLMYSSDFKRMLLHENVQRVLAILKVASAIVFEAAIVASLEYLEAVPWCEDEEEKIFCLVSQLQNDYPSVAGSVLGRLVRPARPSVLALPPPICPSQRSSDNDFSLLQPEEVLVKLVRCVIKATDEKARREMKPLVSRLLRENTAALASNKSSTAGLNTTATTTVVDVSKESLYDACKECLQELSDAFSRLTEQQQQPASSAQAPSLVSAAIARHVDNIQWLAELLIDRGVAEELVHIWSRESQLAAMHRLLPAMQRHEVSRITARLCIGIGRGQIMAPQQVRALLLATWLEPLMDDFSWMQRLGSKITCSSLCYAGGNGGGFLVLDKKTVEEGLCQTILTLSLEEQRSILMSWFEKFSRDGDNCPNLQRAFEVWWRRTFASGIGRQPQ